MMMNDIDLYRPTNEFNTTLGESYYDGLSQVVIEDIKSAIDEIVFIQRLISPSMPSVGDLDKDELGRIIVDVTNPHKLENMEFFTKAADHFRKYGCYTLLAPNKHPKSPYYTFWREEKSRIRNGLIREDGEWISGELYWYWNYAPILKTRRINANMKRAERIVDFPDVWLGDYLFFHYKDQARNLGQHVELMKVRGVGASFKMGALGPRNALFYKKSKTFYVASDMQYLTKDGIITKAWDYLDFLAEHTPFPRLRVIDRQLEKRIGYKDPRTGAEKGMKSDVIGLSTKDDPDKIRGKRGDINFEEYGAYPHIKKAWAISRASVEDGENVFGQISGLGCVCAGTKVYVDNGEVKNIEDVTSSDKIVGYDRLTGKAVLQPISYMQPPANKECVRIHTPFRTLECSIDHPILVRRGSEQSINQSYGKPKVYNIKGRIYEYPRKKRSVHYHDEWVNAGDLTSGDVILVCDNVDIWGTKQLFDPRLVGMLIGDGSYGMRAHYDKMEFKTPSFSNCDPELINYVLSNYDSCIEKSNKTKDGKDYCEIRIRGIIGKLKEVGIAGQSKSGKRLPVNFDLLTKNDAALLLAGLFDTDGTVIIGDDNYGPRIAITQSSEEIIVQIKQLLEKFGINSIVRRVEPRISPDRKDKNPYYTLTISNKHSILKFRQNIPLMIGYKIENLNKIINSLGEAHQQDYKNIPGVYGEKISKIDNIGQRAIYNLTADGTNTYLANGIITHNTGGSIGADFEGAEDMFYHPGSYNILGVPNVYDRNSTGQSECGLFWGAYLNRSNCYDKNGMPDVTKALRELFVELDRIRKTSSDPKAITQRRAEYPITPTDSMMKIDGTIFPVADLRDHLESIKINQDEFTGAHYVGDLVINKDATISWRLNGEAKPIRDFPLKDNKHEGAIEIFEMPFMINGEAQRNRYICGVDGYDDDASDTVSLGSIFVLDLFTDRIVAEYTGRPKYANDFFEICRRLGLFYNAQINYENDKKGMLGYFDRKNSTYLLSETLQSLKDAEMVRGNLYGNKKYGTNSGRFINARGRQLLRDWMMTPAHGDDAKLNLHKIRSIGLLLEAIKWNPNGNYDRISALGMLMLLREDRQKYLDARMSGGSIVTGTGLQFDRYFIKNSGGTLSHRREAWPDQIPGESL